MKITTYLKFSPNDSIFEYMQNWQKQFYIATKFDMTKNYGLLFTSNIANNRIASLLLTTTTRAFNATKRTITQKNTQTSPNRNRKQILLLIKPSRQRNGFFNFIKQLLDH